ncbi:alpha/beta hydrolase [Streptomyces venezuelae]|uniref:Alpha/beta hydrolase n=1 Tax=Streptomyces venezuelae TaxID=54571 RepID=A0A5P2AZE6_STRVZ|nr:alpha/beta hydrolase [Streptomyces venezuelae]
MRLSSPPPPVGSQPLQRPEVVRRHRWDGLRCESRLVRAAAPRLGPVLLIGGAFQSKETWGRCEKLFLANMDVFTVDPPGWGAADPLPPGKRVDVLADAVCHILDESGLRQVNVVGGSYGSAIAYRIAQRHPDRVGRMVLVGTMAAIPEHSRQAMHRALAFLDAGRMDEYARAAVDIMMNPGRLDGITNGARVRRFLLRRLAALSEAEVVQVSTNTLRLLRHAELDTSVPVSAPTLTVTGEHDAFTTPAQCRRMALACGTGWFAEVAESDHMLFLERPAEITDLVTRFLSDEPLHGLPYCTRVEQLPSSPFPGPRAVGPVPGGGPGRMPA